MAKSGKKVVVGMSGGVDSSVAAALLKKEGYSVQGVYMKNWADPKYPCPWEEDRRDAMRVAALLDIPFETWDFSREYREAVVSYMIEEYAEGRTPNPDIMCNREIKFGVFLKRALECGADFVATGHYARVREIKNQKSKIKIMVRQAHHPEQSRGTNQNSKVYELLEGVDKNKDQSYFLWTLAQNQLKHCLFPIGEYLKNDVRQIARECELPTAGKPDSQGVCFVGEIDVAQFLRDHIPAKRGAVVTTGGKTVGEHDGAVFYTIGQRHGLGVGGGIPFYVARKDVKTNTLVVAEGPNDDGLFKTELIASDVNWISDEPQFPLECEARIRYRQPLQACRLEAQKSAGDTQNGAGNSSANVRVVFQEDQRAVTPGQSVVFYRDGAMLGGGIIAGE